MKHIRTDKIVQKQTFMILRCTHTVKKGIGEQWQLECETNLWRFPEDV